MPAGSVPTIGVGLLGYSGVARAHLNALKKIGYIFWPLPARLELVGICGRTPPAVAQAAARYGFAYGTTDWRKLAEDPAIQLFINCAPNDLHAEPCLAAASAGMHLLCEKPLARDAREARRLRDGVRRRALCHQVSYNYRFIPAVRLARDMIRAGELGDLLHFRMRYSDDSLSDPRTPHTWRQDRARAGSGVVGDLASHALDLGRFLAGEVRAVCGFSRIVTPRRPAAGEASRLRVVDVEDCYAGALRFESGALGTLEASGCCPGQKNYLTFEANGTRGSLRFNLERLNELEVFRMEPSVQQDRGFKTVLVTDADHPFGGRWWPPGHILGWEHTFVHQLHHLLQAIAGEGKVEPLAASFQDGYANAVLCDALLQAARTGRQVAVTPGRVSAGR
jgi:predicted dehydrogenase